METWQLDFYGCQGFMQKCLSATFLGNQAYNTKYGYIKLNIIGIKRELVAQFGLGVLEIVSGVNDISIKCWTIIVEGLLGWVEWWLEELEVPVMSNNTFGDPEILGIVNNISVDTKVWNWIVDWIWELLMLVLVLSASS